MARAALKLNLQDMADIAGISELTVRRVERGLDARHQTLAALRAAFEGAGIEFIDGDAPGVRLRRRNDTRWL
jgi:transcriptional regulator with XRE-family HTH domain